VLDPGKARATAKDILAKVRLGGDPANERDDARTRASETFSALLKPFMLRQQSRLRRSSLRGVKRHLLTLCRELHPLPIAALTRRTIAARLAVIAQTSGARTANQARSSLSTFCTWAVKEGFLDTNPAANTNKAVVNGPRDRLLTDDELVKIWGALGDSPFGVVIKLLVFTGLRRGEIADLRWSEVDLDANLITLPPARTKNGKLHLVPMASPVRALIEAQPRRRERVFSNVEWYGAKAKLDARIADMHGAALLPWTIHDFRRKFSTDLHEKLNVLPHVVEILLGHIGGHKAGVAGTYNLAVYRGDCARALERWAAHITALVTGEPAAAKVIQLRT
jgi:integrase